MSLCTIPNNGYGHHKCCIYVCCGNKCENVHCSFNFIFLDLICEKTRNNTLLFFVYVLVRWPKIWPFSNHNTKIF